MLQSKITVVPPGEGEKHWIVGDNITFKVAAPLTRGVFDIAETLVLPQAGPPPHMHHREHECFYVLQGQFMFCLGDHVITRGAGSALFLPKSVPHLFKNIGDTHGRLLVLALPSGFKEFVTQAGEAVSVVPHPKTVGPDDIGKLMRTIGQFGLEVLMDYKPKSPGPDAPADRKVWVMGNLISIKLAGAQTLDTMTLVEIESPPGAAVPMHAHVVKDEFFHVVEGAFEFSTADGKFIASAGTSVHVPPGVMHGFQNIGGTTARMVDYHFPGGFEDFFLEIGTGERNAPLPEMNALHAMFKKHGMVLPG